LGYGMRLNSGKDHQLKKSRAFQIDQKYFAQGFLRVGPRDQ
jgi:hypothetical protein